MKITLDDILKATGNWPSTQSLLLIFVIETISIKFLFTSTVNSFLLIETLILLPTLLFWLYCRKMPKKSKNTFGVVISIYCDDSLTEKNFREDFIKTLKKQLEEGENHNNIECIELKKHISENINNEEDAKQVLKKCNGNYLLYGRVRTRGEEKDKNHFLELNCFALLCFALHCMPQFQI